MKISIRKQKKGKEKKGKTRQKNLIIKNYQENEITIDREEHKNSMDGLIALSVIKQKVIGLKVSQAYMISFFLIYSFNE